MIRVGVVGVSGYSGALIFEILLKHPDVRVTTISALQTTGPIEDILPHLIGRTELACEKFDFSKAIERCDVLFLAVPHHASMEITPTLLKNKKRVIDLSADYRFPKADIYQKWYEKEHQDIKNITKAIYGLPELYREHIRKAKLLANPGCYPTAAILGLAPLLATRSSDVEAIIIDAKSGVSGAGKKVTPGLMFCETHENFKAYKVLTHQHTPEINLYLSRVAQKPLEVTFVTHLLPIKDGILETIYVRLKEKIKSDDLGSAYKKFYKTEPFVRILKAGQQPEIRNVLGTNFCDLGLVVSEDGKTIVITSVIDNLMKGAAGQAVQNMNIMCGFKETEALV